MPGYVRSRIDKKWNYVIRVFSDFIASTFLGHGEVILLKKKKIVIANVN